MYNRNGKTIFASFGGFLIVAVVTYFLAELSPHADRV